MLELLLMLLELLMKVDLVCVNSCSVAKSTAANMASVINNGGGKIGN